MDWFGDPINSFPLPLFRRLLHEGKLKKQLAYRPFGVFFNIQHPSFKSVNVRRALSAAVDPSCMCRDFVSNMIPIHSPLPNSSHNTKPMFNHDYQLETDLSPIVISHSDHPILKQSAMNLKEIWEKKFPITVQLEKIEWNLLRSRLESGRFQVSSCFVTPYYNSPMALLERFEYKEDPSNYSQWTHSDYKKILSLARQTLDNEELFNKAENILIQQAPVIPICNRVHYYIAHPKLKGFTFDHAGCVDFSRAYFEEGG